MQDRTQRRGRFMVGTALLLAGAAILAYSLSVPCAPPNPRTGAPPACLGPGVAEILGVVVLLAVGLILLASVVAERRRRPAATMDLSESALLDARPISEPGLTYLYQRRPPTEPKP